MNQVRDIWPGNIEQLALITHHALTLADVPLRRSGCLTTPPAKLNDYVCHSLTSPCPRLPLRVPGIHFQIFYPVTDCRHSILPFLLVLLPFWSQPLMQSRAMILNGVKP